MDPHQPPQGRMRRSSSRSPSLTRRPSLKDKPSGSGISKSKKKGSGSKKERWLLTRKTWRYMSDAVGSLLPEAKDKTTRSSSPLGPSTSRRPSSSLSSPVTPTTPGPVYSYHGIVPAGHGYSVTTGSVPASHSYGIVTGMPQPWPLFSPITYQEIQGKRASTARSSICSSSGLVPEPEHDIPALEDNFENACKKEKKFLLWTRTKAKGLSGPALHELKMKGERTRTSSSSSLAPRPETPDTPREHSDSGHKKSIGDHLEYYSPEDEDLMDDYDEYEPDEEQMTVREFPPRKSSSGASSVVSMISGGISFWRPPSTAQSHSQPFSSSDSFYVVTLGPGIQKDFRSTGVQTEPIPEEILIRLRLHSVREEQYQRAAEAEKLEAVKDSRVPGGIESPPELEGHELILKGSVPSETSGISTEDKKSEESGYSSSISDTVMRYLRMVRKNSKADTKEDRFKTVNYDRSLRYIKSKNVTVEEALEHEKNKALAQQKGQTGTSPGGQGPDAPGIVGIPSKSVKESSAPIKISKKETGPSTTKPGMTTKKKRSPSITTAISQSSLSGGTTTPSTFPSEGVSSPECGPTPPLSPTPPEVLPPPPPPPPSIGVQTAETLIRFFKNLNPIRKFSDLSSYYGSSESPGEFTSPRYSIATGSDGSEIYTQGDDGLRSSHHHPSSSYYGGGSELDENWSSYHAHRPSSYVPPSQYPSEKLKKSSSTLQMGGSGRPYFYNTHQDSSSTGRKSSSSTPSTPTTTSSKPGHSEIGKSSSGHIPSSYPSGPGHFLSGLRRKGSGGRDKEQSGGGGTGYTAPSTGTGGGFAESLSNFISKHSPVISSSGGSSGRAKHDSASGGGGVSFSLKRAGSGLAVEPRDHSSSVTTPSSSSYLVMQKSKSSSSVFHGEKRGSTSSSGGGGGLTTIGGPSPSTSSSGSRLMSKTRIFKSRSKSTGRSSTPACSWMPQGNGRWTSVSGQQVDLQDTTLMTLSDKEAEFLQKVAQAKLQVLNPDLEIKIPKETPTNQKPKRRAHVLKKKAMSTGFFDSSPNKEESGAGGGGGRVFGIPLSQCLLNDKEKARKGSRTGQTRPKIIGYFDVHSGDTKRSENGSRNSLTSVHETSLLKDKMTGSSESLFGGNKFVGGSGSVAGTSTVPDHPAQYIPLPGGGAVPSFLIKSIEFLEANGLHTVGIFRVSPSLKRVRQLREEIDGGSNKDLEFGEEHSVHDIAALLKEFLRDLPEPLLTRDLNPAFMNTRAFQSNRKLQLEATQHLIKLLPPPNRDALEVLLRFLAKVAKHATDSVCPLTGELLKGNKMDSCNLATVMAPNFLPLSAGAPALDPSSSQTRDRRDSIDIIDFMISNYADLFDVTVETLDEIYNRMLEAEPEALEGLLKQKAGTEDPLDEAETTSSVFEGSEPGEPWETDDTTRRVQRRQDVLHRDAGKGGDAEQKGLALGKMEKIRGRKDANRDGGDQGDGDKLSGGDSDGSTTKSRWFRRGRPDKSRTSSDSGSEKSKGKRRDSSLGEQKRASSLDSVSLKTTGVGGPLVLTEEVDRNRSSSAQNLKVPELLNRRQSSPILEGSGVITASLKIPVPLKLDESDIPYIEEEHLEGRLVLRQEDDMTPSGKVRAEIGSAEAGIGHYSRGGTPSSHASTPPSSPGRHSSSSLPLPPVTPPYDEDGFQPVEEMTARFFIGPGQPFAPTPIPPRTTTVVTQSKLNKLPTGGILRVLPVPTHAHSKVEAESPAPDHLVTGKETKGANIAGVIKSKTADFEKIAKQAQTSSGTSTIAQTLRLRSQGNIQLKQEFLLRQQQLNLPSRGVSTPASRSASTDRTRPLTRKKPEVASAASGTTTVPRTPTRYKRSELISSRQEGAGGSGAQKDAHQQ